MPGIEPTEARRAPNLARNYLLSVCKIFTPLKHRFGYCLEMFENSDIYHCVRVKELLHVI